MPLPDHGDQAVSGHMHGQDNDQWFCTESRRLHHRVGSLVQVLRSVLLKVQMKEDQALLGAAHGDNMNLQEMQTAVELLEELVLSLRELRRGPHTDVVVTTSSRTRSWEHVSSTVCCTRLASWKDVVSQDRATVLYLTHQAVSDVLRRYNIAEQNHNHQTLEYLLRIAHCYNETLQLATQDCQAVSMWCSNTCPILLHPLRKFSITKILQVLAQFRAEQCCSSLVTCLLENFWNTQEGKDISLVALGPSSPEHSDNSSLVVYRTLVRQMSPPEGTALPPVERVTRKTGVKATASEEPATALAHPATPRWKLETLSPRLAADLDQLVSQEEIHVATLLGVTLRSAPHFLGQDGIRTSKTSGNAKVPRKVKQKVTDYYQQVLWGEVGSFMEHVVLWWWYPCLATYPPDWSCSLRVWTYNITANGRVPQMMVPAMQSLIDSLGCHVSTTVWDHMFRQALVSGRLNTRYSSRSKQEGARTGELMTGLLEGLVSLSNSCEVTTAWLSSPPVEDLPLVEQIPVLHRLDHSVHYARTWTAAQARHLANNWAMDTFFLVAHSDVHSCLGQLALLQLAEHKDLSSVHSEHVVVCAQMRNKLVSEVRENINKLKKLPGECLEMLANVCRTISLANLCMFFPGPQYWKQSGNPTRHASPYVDKYLEEVLRPVLSAMIPLPISVQQEVGGMVLRIMCESWLDHIYTHRIKFTPWGAVQLLADFAAVSSWLAERAKLHTQVLSCLLRHEVLRRCEGVGRLLLRRPGEPITMLAPDTNTCGTEDDGDGAVSRQDTMMPAEMYVPNQQQWLELRASAHTLGLCGYFLCCPHS